MNIIDRAIAAFSPQRAVERAKARMLLKALNGYDGARPSRTRKVNRDNSTAETHIVRDATTVRAMARNLERNHDIARGALSVLVRNTIGPTGISVEPTPRLANDDIDDGFARALLNEWRLWGQSTPEVTSTMDWVQVQQMVARTVFRDGEQLTQVIEGRGDWTVNQGDLPLMLELMEADMLPMDCEHSNPDIFAGIERSAWGRPLAYWLHKTHPGDGRMRSRTTADLDRIPAAKILHLAMRDRFSGLRGVSVFSSTLDRIENSRDYESSEQLAASIASRIALAVERDKDMNWTPPSVPADGKPRDLRLDSGAILDELLPGETLNMVNPSRPNPAMVDYLRHQHRGFAAGIDSSYSSTARDYDGSFAAQRQEMIESQSAYQIITNYFIGRFNRPVWKRFVRIAIATGRVKPPKGVREETYDQAEFRGPVMPWIDPVKEANAQVIMVRAGFKSMQQVIAERGGRLQDTFEQIKRERALAAELGIQFDSNLADDKAPEPAPGEE